MLMKYCKKKVSSKYKPHTSTTKWGINLKYLQLLEVIQITLEKGKIFGKKGQEKTMVQILKLITVKTEMETASTC